MTTKKATTSRPARRTASKRTSTTGKATARVKETKPASAKAGTKKSIVLELLRRKEGATTAEMAKATDWQNHSIRGFINGHVAKRMGLAVESSKNEAEERTYRIAE